MSVGELCRDMSVGELCRDMSVGELCHVGINLAIGVGIAVATRVTGIDRAHRETRERQRFYTERAEREQAREELAEAIFGWL